MSQIYRQSLSVSTLKQLCYHYKLAYCEIPEVIGVRISKEGVVAFPVLQFWLSEGCPGLNPQFGEGVNMAVYWPF